LTLGMSGIKSMPDKADFLYFTRHLKGVYLTLGFIYELSALSMRA
jgi:hypothetical protein